MAIFLIIIFFISFLGLCKFVEKLHGYYVWIKEVDKLPGPSLGFPVIGPVITLLRIKTEDRIRWGQELAKPFKDGIFRLWVGGESQVHINKPEHIEVILRSTRLIEKSFFYNYLKPWLGKGLLTADGEKWFHDRKLITPAFHFGILEDFAEVMIEKAGILNQRFSEKVKLHGDKPFDIFDMVGQCALDVICETAMGVNVHAQDEVKSEYIRSVQWYVTEEKIEETKFFESHITTEAINRAMRPWLKFDWIYYRTESGKLYKAAVETAHEKCTRIIERRMKEKLMKIDNNNVNNDDDIDKPKRRAFLDSLLEANENSVRPLTIEEIREQVNTFMFAGHDTTGALICWSLLCIGNDEKLQNKIHQELDEVFGDSNEPATTKQVSQLKYLDRVIKEALRLYPSAATIGRKIFENLQMGKYTVPKDSTLVVQIYQLHRDPEHWPNPTKFDPDRFLPENSRQRHPYAYVPFSGGLRNCIGQKYALLEAKIILAEILRKWRVKSRDTCENIKLCNLIILRPHEGIFLNMYERSVKNGAAD